LGLGVALALASVAFAATPVAVWPGASELALPANANTTAGHQNAMLNSVVCPSVGHCVGIGEYKDTTGSTQALLATQSAGGAWQASELTLPAGANTTAGGQNAQLESVNCPTPGTCVATGFYTDTTGSNPGMVATQSPGGSWQASELTLPAGANTTAGHQSADLNSVVCTTVGNCVAVGDYRDTTGSLQGMVATQSAGGAWQASELTLPAGANTTAGAQSAFLGSVVCPSAGHCVGIGDYRDTTGSTQAMVATQSAGGAWQASELTLPAGANTTAGHQDAVLNSVVCTSAGNCVAVGNYIDTGTRRQAMVATQSAGGAWQVSELTLPAGANTTAGVQSAFLRSVACPIAGTCAAAGLYRDTTASDQALVATQSAGGAWQASELTLPANANTTADHQDAELNSVACASAGNCAAAGFYADTTGSQRALVATQSVGGAWQASELTLPANANTTAGNQVDLNSVVCPSAGYCTTAGFYKDTTGSFQALVASSVASLGVGTTSMPSGADGSAYSARLSATGGAGGGTWSLSSGSLPAGLSLNGATGVISGVPRAVGRSNFTVTVSDPGPPVQHATVPLSITVGPAPPAAIRQVKTSGSLLTLTLSCRGSAGQTCLGTLKLSALEHLTGHRITAVTASKPKKTAKPKKTTKTVTLASTTYAFTGASTTLKITLDTTGKHLLATYHKLSAKLTLTPTGARTPATTKTITFKAPPAKHKHR
jgi:large repetitive protein